MAMTNSDLLALAMPLIAVAAVSLAGVLIAFQIKHDRPRRSTAPSRGVAGTLSEVGPGLFRFQPDADTASSATLHNRIEKETAGH